MSPHETLPGLATARDLHPSSGTSAQPIGIHALEAIASGLAAVVTGEPTPPAPGEVRRHRVIATDAYDAWVVTIGAHTSIAAHDHDGCIGVIAVTDGRLVEFGVDEGGRPRARLRQLVAGDATKVGITQRHSLVNPGAAPATTVQVFSPPLGAHTD